MDVDYRRTWDRLQEMEQRLGITLVERQTGGPGGGGARLTPAGYDYVSRFNRFVQGIDDLVATQYRETFGSQ